MLAHPLPQIVGVGLPDDLEEHVLLTRQRLLPEPGDVQPEAGHWMSLIALLYWCQALTREEAVMSVPDQCDKLP